MNHTRHEIPEPTPATDAELLEDLQAQIGELLTTIATLLPLAGVLLDSRQRGLSFMTYEGRETQSRVHRAERSAIAKRLAGSKIATWGPGVDIVATGLGESPSPGNLGGLSTAADVTFTLHHHARYLINLQARQGVCTLIRIPSEPTAGQLLAALRRLVWETTQRGHLEAIRRDLEYLRDEILRLIDGPTRVPYPDVACPYCGRPTLVAIFDKGVVDAVECDKDQTTGHRHPCTCPDPLCDCKVRPVGYRHSWHRARGNKPDGLATLTGRLNLSRKSSEKGPTT